MITDALDDIHRRQRNIRMSSDGLLGRDTQSKSSEERVLEKQENYIMAVVAQAQSNESSATSATSAKEREKKQSKATYDAWRILEAIRKNNFSLPYGVQTKITDWLAANEKQFRTQSRVVPVLKWECCACGEVLQAEAPKTTGSLVARYGDEYTIVRCDGCDTRYRANWGKWDHACYTEHKPPFVEPQ